jgi:DNA-directed RNA polymerase beta subunit
VYTIGGQETVKSFEDVMIGKIPLMLQSQLCYLSSMTPDQLYEAGECKFEPGGYFIIGGSEKVLLTQEKLGNNLFYAGKRVFDEPKVSSGLAEKGTEASIKGPKERYEFYSGVRSASEDGTRGPYSHFLVIPPANVLPSLPTEIEKSSDYAEYSTKRLAAITLPGFVEAVPLLSVFRALGIATDQDLYNTVLAGVPVADRQRYDMILTELILSHEYYIRRENKERSPQKFLRADGIPVSADSFDINRGW